MRQINDGSINPGEASTAFARPGCTEDPRRRSRGADHEASRTTSSRLHGLGRGKRALVERALETLCSVYARQMHLLEENPSIPDRALDTLIEWADDLGAANPEPGLDLDVLEEVLPALNVALLASYAYSTARPGGRRFQHHKVDLVLSDRGGALLVERSRAIARFLAVALHGQRGARLVARADAGLRKSMDSISQAIARHD
jgi:hypothetical protein